jgi:hypothetical protein
MYRLNGGKAVSVTKLLAAFRPPICKMGIRMVESIATVTNPFALSLSKGLLSESPFS